MTPANPTSKPAQPLRILSGVQPSGKLHLGNYFGANCPNLRVVPPVSKRLACDDVGVGALAERGQIVEVVNEVLKPKVREVR